MVKSSLVVLLVCVAFGEGFSQPLFVPARDKHISYEGRIRMSKDAAELIWPGTSVKIYFEGTGISGELKDQDTSNYYNIIVDGNVTGKIHPDTSKKSYLLAAHLPYGRHSVELYKRTEWDKGKTWFYGFIFERKAIVAGLPKKPVRKLEFFGNSITCGYAIEDRVNDSPIGYYENNYDSYAAITARHFNAQCHYTAKSGIGVMVSWFPLIMPEMYNRLDPTDPGSRWDFSTYVPDVVVINLLQNDAWIINQPTNEQFKQRFGTRRPSEDFIIQAYRNFVRKIREAYPNARIICMLGNMDLTRDGSPWPGYVEKAVAELNDPRIFIFVVPYKDTPGHPKTEEQRAMGEKLIEFINKHIGWSATGGPKPIITGADQTSLYLPLLKGKRVGVLGNPTTIIGNRPLVDSLHELKIDIREVFGPEHGFRGKASNGAKVADEIDSATGIPIISLYGTKRKPSKEDMDAIDILIYDVQDVGCRFYTNINVLRNIMEACAESGKELLILDRPDPNGYVDGPILDMSLKSGIGQFPVPIVHGMTIGEFAKMINGEGWLPNKEQCKLTVIAVKNYAHGMYYKLPVSPSPNLNTQQSVLLYPSLCPFEGTVISQGRGTHMPFCVLGNPDLKGSFAFSFTPVSIPGMSETPLHENQTCYGLDLRSIDADSLRKTGKLNLTWMMELYKAYPYQSKFFDYHQSKEMGDINKLAGTTAFKEQIASGMSEAAIRKTWEPGLSNYKQMRKKYLLYP